MRLFVIEYGKAVYYLASKRGKTYHKTHPLTKREVKSRLEKLNKIWDYTTVQEIK
jgi:hypothetical protein